ncbi:hypothetical protein F4V43_15740 [Paenibacillus spiritus]|uniref:Copper amine oxidase-like N-terminal domain-containing protein n=1 Tax=Paenibacillus spiritus TaxID=2496557 RepID=A0A5J5G006_9BACL|nr:stalk domain-containing protein [Paenibacillus spiritus]KAA8999775.1 hypothetical protein F4V43_15740 [Paenibacillus spiritus]
MMKWKNRILPFGLAILLLGGTGPLTQGASAAGETEKTPVVKEFGPGALIKSDGTLWTWGGSQPVPTQVSDYPAPAGLLGEGYVRGADGSLGVITRTGYPSVVSVRTASGVSDVQQVIYYGPTLARDGSGRVYMNERTDQGWDDTSFTKIEGLSDVTDMAAYKVYTSEYGYEVEFMFLKKDGTVWKDTDSRNDSVSSLVQVPGLQDVVELENDVALRKDGTVWSMTEHRALSDAPQAPGQVPGLSNIAVVKQDGYQSFVAVDRQGRLWFWGGTITGWSDGTQYHDQKPIRLTGVSQVVDAFVIERSLLALTRDGKLYETSIETETLSPSAPFGLIASDIATARASYRDLLFQKNDGSLWGWGVGKDYALGNASDEFWNFKPVPVQSPISVTLNGENVAFTSGVVTKDGQNFVPMRALFGRMGASIGYDNTTKTATVTRPSADGRPALTIAASGKTGKITLNGKEAKVLNEPFIVSGTLYLPIRFISEQLGATVAWSPGTQQIDIVLN